MPPPLGPTPKLVYVASVGRSGSTLLEELLAGHPRIASIGEVHLWPHELRVGGRHLPCGCGLPIDECPFWIEMRARVDPLTQSEPRLDHFREAHTGGRTLRLGRVADFRPTGGRAPSHEIEVYADNTARVLSAYADLTGELTGTRPEWVVDASKDPYRLAWLVRSGRFDLTVLHVVRDPRGFVNSERTNVDASGLGLLGLATRKAGAWMVQNELIRLACRALPAGRSAVVRYEALASDPEATMRHVCDVNGCGEDAGLIDRFRTTHWHAIGGNPMRHDDRGIALDERWRKALSPGAQRVAQLLTAPLRSRFGY